MAGRPFPRLGRHGNGGLTFVGIAGKPARALGDQIQSVDRVRLRSRLAVLSADEMRLVDEALLITLDLRVE